MQKSVIRMFKCYRFVHSCNMHRNMSLAPHWRQRSTSSPCSRELILIYTFRTSNMCSLATDGKWPSLITLPNGLCSQLLNLTVSRNIFLLLLFLIVCSVERIPNISTMKLNNNLQCMWAQKKCPTKWQTKQRISLV